MNDGAANAVPGLVSPNVMFQYDQNGNVTSAAGFDPTNNSDNQSYGVIFSIPSYDARNLPLKTVNGRKTVLYRYNAAGQRIYKGLTTTTVAKEHYLMNGAETVAVVTELNGSFTFKHWNTAFGRAEKVSGSYVMYYYLKDHLGSTRVTLRESDKVAVEAQDFEPWGGIMPGRSFLSGASPTKEKFTGKERDADTGFDYFGARYYASGIGRWLSVDPLADQFPSWTPYHFVHNNPINLIDPDGRAAMPPDDYIFNEKGDYVRTDINNKPDRIVIENSTTGKVQGTYNFADPSDAKAIDAGTINKVLFVDINRIGKMLGEAGAFDATNRDNEWSYMNTESKGGGKLDFSYSAIPTEFASDGASSHPLKTPSPMLFIPEGDGNAHNHMNFGNFLWGAAGHSLGFSKGTLKAAAHYNSLFNSSTNGYPSQWDSADDQFSIGRGVDLSNRNQFRDRTWSPSTGLSAPPKKRKL